MKHINVYLYNGAARVNPRHALMLDSLGIEIVAAFMQTELTGWPFILDDQRILSYVNWLLETDNAH